MLAVNLVKEVVLVVVLEVELWTLHFTTICLEAHKSTCKFVEYDAFIILNSSQSYGKKKSNQ